MTCFVIDPNAKTITSLPWYGGLDEIRQLIGFETIDSDKIDASGDRLFSTKNASSARRRAWAVFNSTAWPRWRGSVWWWGLGQLPRK
jgi:hypothetical protein